MIFVCFWRKSRPQKIMVFMSAFDPKRRLATVNYRIAKGSFDYLVSVATADRRAARLCSRNVIDFRSTPINRNSPAETGGSYFRRGALLLLVALLAGLAGLLLLLIRLLLSTALLSALTWLLARLLGLLSALILITLGHSYLQLERELARDGQLPARVLCSFQRNIYNQRSFRSNDRKSVECRLI
jgi:hypothetical protein